MLYSLHTGKLHELYSKKMQQPLAASWHDSLAASRIQPSKKKKCYMLKNAQDKCVILHGSQLRHVNLRVHFLMRMFERTEFEISCQYDCSWLQWKVLLCLPWHLVGFDLWGIFPYNCWELCTSLFAWDEICILEDCKVWQDALQCCAAPRTETQGLTFTVTGTLLHSRSHFLVSNFKSF